MTLLKKNRNAFVLSENLQRSDDVGTRGTGGKFILNAEFYERGLKILKIR